MENGAGLLRTIDCLFKDVQTLNQMDCECTQLQCLLTLVHHTAGTKALTVEGLKRRTGVSDGQLDTEIIEPDLPDLAGCFDEVETYLYKLNLTPGQQTDVKDLAYRQSTMVAMTEALKLWRQPNPFATTFRTLLNITLSLGRGDVAVRICKYVTENVRIV